MSDRPSMSLMTSLTSSAGLSGRILGGGGGARMSGLVRSVSDPDILIRNFLRLQTSFPFILNISKSIHSHKIYKQLKHHSTLMRTPPNCWVVYRDYRCLLKYEYASFVRNKLEVTMPGKPRFLFPIFSRVSFGFLLPLCCIQFNKIVFAAIPLKQFNYNLDKMMNKI